MFIALVLPEAPGYSETFFTNKIRGLAESGIKVVVFTNGSPCAGRDYRVVNGFSWRAGWVAKISALANASLRLVRSPLRTFGLYRLNKRCGYPLRKNCLSLLSSAHILKFDPDWLHFGFAVSALGRENVGAVIGARLAASVRGFDIAVYPIKNPGCYELLWERLDKLHYISDDLLSLAARNGFDTEREHRKIRPAIETAMFESSRPPDPGKPVRFLTVARLHWKKGLEYTLQALKILADSGVDFRYTVVGEGEERERLVFAAHQLGIKDKVLFVGKKTPEEVRHCYREADVYLQYSIQEGFCNAVLEAQAAGLLCLVSDAEGLAENIRHGRTGWVVPKRDPKLLAERITAVLNLSEPELNLISGAAAGRVRSEFGLERQKREFVEFYQ